MRGEVYLYSGVSNANNDGPGSAANGGGMGG